jgi:hypothetical protein
MSRAAFRELGLMTETPCKRLGPHGVRRLSSSSTSHRPYERGPPAMPGRLFGKTAIITGSSSGLDRAIAHVYAQEGAQIDLYPSPTTGKAEPFHNGIATGTPAHEALRETYGGRYIFVCADLTKAEDVERAVTTCAKKFGRLDVIVNNAGISVESTHVRPLRIHETAEDGYDKIMAVNAKEAFLGVMRIEVGSSIRQVHKAWLDIVGPVCAQSISLAHEFFVAQSICLDFNFRARSVAAPD